MFLVGLNLANPLSLYSIPVVWFTSFYPAMWKFLTIDRLVGYNNVQPRSNTANLKTAQSKAITPAMAARIERMEGAHLNGNEVFPLWAAAILAGNYAGLDNHWMNKMAVTYIAIRFLYNHTYIDYNTIANGWLRTFLFFGGLSFPLRIIIKAAGKVATQ